MKSHLSLNGGVAVACAVAGASTMLNGNCSAQTFIAADYPTNSTYAAGWAAGQNGGYGFGPWSMDFTYNSSPQNTIDRASPYDPFGVAWTLYNPVAWVSPPYPASGQPPGWPGGCDNPPSSAPPAGSDISRAGRAIPNGGLGVGQTFSTIISNPTDRHYYKGYTIVLSSGSDNIQYGSAGLQLGVGTFEYNNSSGNWYAGLGSGTVSLYDTDTTTNGMRLEVTMTDTNSYHLIMTPLGNPAIAYTEDGTLENKGLTDQGPVNWITYQLYNTDSDFYNFTNGIPSMATNCAPNRTDFYIQSMTIAGLNIQRAGTNVLVTWPTNVDFNLQSTFNLGPAAFWTNSTAPTVINGQNVVTNPIGARQFYRLQR